MSLANEIDDRTTKEQLRDLGVLEALTVENVRWIKPYSSHPKSRLVTVGKEHIRMPAFIVDDLGGRMFIGTGKYRGSTVLLLKADKEGYKPCSMKTGRKKVINAPGLIARLLKAGITPGCYEPVKIKGGWMCERVKP